MTDSQKQLIVQGIFYSLITGAGPFYVLRYSPLCLWDYLVLFLFYGIVIFIHLDRSKEDE